MPLTALSEPQYGTQRRVEPWIACRITHVGRVVERYHRPGRIFRAAQRAVKSKGNGRVREEFKLRARQPDFTSFFRSARNKTDRLNGGRGGTILQTDVIRSWQSTTHQNTATGRTHVRVI